MVLAARHINAIHAVIGGRDHRTYLEWSTCNSCIASPSQFRPQISGTILRDAPNQISTQTTCKVSSDIQFGEGGAFETRSFFQQLVVSVSVRLSEKAMNTTFKVRIDVRSTCKSLDRRLRDLKTASRAKFIEQGARNAREILVPQQVSSKLVRVYTGKLIGKFPERS